MFIFSDKYFVEATCILFDFSLSTNGILYLYLGNPLYVRDFQIFPVSTSLIHLVIFRGNYLRRRTVLGTWMFYFTHSWHGHVKDSSGPLCSPAALTPIEGPSYPTWAQHLSRRFRQKENLVLLPEIGTRFLAHSIPANSLTATSPRINRPASWNVLFVRNARRPIKSIFYVVYWLL